jgi:hypothetical protein
VIKPKHNAVSAVERKSSTGANEKDKATTAKTPDVTTPAKKEVNPSVRYQFYISLIYFYKPPKFIK